MLGFGRKNFNSTMTTVYVFLFILILNQFLLTHSYVVMHNGQYQNQLENPRHNAIQQIISKYFTNSEDSSSDDIDVFKPTVQRRFCCMSPLSGRKRSIRNILRKRRQASNELNQ